MHVYQASDRQGHVAYYRVQIDGSATLAKTSYRSGFYDAAAVDALFGTTSEGDTDSVDETLERHRRQAVDVLAKQYYDTLAAGKGGETASLQALESAISPIPRDKKFVIIHSANASVVEAAIADFAEEKDTQDAVLSLIAPFKRDDYLQAKADQEALSRTSAIVQKAAADLAAMKDPAPGKEPDPAYKDQLKRILSDLATLPVQ
jgi:hypothetical protein